jgi:hypothetical protein
MAKWVTFVIALALACSTAAFAAAPPGASARCRDGTYSHSKHHAGTCSHHGGVAAWLAPASAAPAVAVAGSRSVPLAPRIRTSHCRPGVLPDRTCSPGAYDPRVTQRNIGRTICTPGYTSRVRNVSQALKDSVYREYGITHHRPYSYEIDHIVSLELGGSNSIANLYPEAYARANGARVKDVLENRLHAAVCSGTLTLRAAQRAIATNWLVAARSAG